MFDELADSLIQESFRPINAKQRIEELIKTPQGALDYALKIKKNRKQKRFLFYYTSYLYARCLTLKFRSGGARNETEC